MSSWIGLLSNCIQETHFAAFFLDALLKSFLVLALAGAACVLLWRSSAATRHLIWFLAVAGLPLLPLLALKSPSWQQPLWSVSSDYDSGNRISLGLEFVPGKNSTTAPLNPQTSRDLAEKTNPAPEHFGALRLFSNRFSADWLVFGLACWAVGAAFILLSVAVGQIRLRKYSGQSQRLQNADWLALLTETRNTLRLRREVVLLQAAGNVMPSTWGCWRPVVVLPAEAEQWPTERRRIVLLHELAHVKRWDCLTQITASVVCAFYWFNPLVWLAARRMRVERERACDDLVLNGGCKASDYAGHLVDIAGSFRRLPQVAAIAMARPSGLEQRIAAIVDASRTRCLRPLTALAILAVAAGTLLSLGRAANSADESKSLRPQQIARLRTFSRLKEQQAQTLAAAAGEKILPEFQRFFDAAIKGDSQAVTTVTNIYESFKQRHPQYSKDGQHPDVSLRTSYWQTALEISLAYDFVVRCDPKYTQLAVDDLINSIPPGSIYFGGTDPGRGLPTAFCKSQPAADPFYTLTQNALADSTYLAYLQSTYGESAKLPRVKSSLYLPTTEDAQKCFQDYYQDVTQRFHNHQLKPGEDVKETDGRVEVSGKTAVMSINALLAKIIFDKNPGHEFYVEESWALDWMYLYLEPHGLILKINREPLAELPEAIVQKDRDYWSRLVTGILGDWLHDDTPVQTVADFAKKTFARKDLADFTGDPHFVQNDYAAKSFSKWRASIAGVYAWRANHAANGPEKERMARAADFAFRQAFALCPYSLEVVDQYVDFLVAQNRIDDAITIATAAAKMPSLQGKMAEKIHWLIEVNGRK